MSHTSLHKLNHSSTQAPGDSLPTIITLNKHPQQWNTMIFSCQPHRVASGHKARGIKFPEFSRAISLLIHRWLQQKAAVIMIIWQSTPAGFRVESWLLTYFTPQKPHLVFVFCLSQFFLKAAENAVIISWLFHKFSRFREFPNYSTFSQVCGHPATKYNLEDITGQNKWEILPSLL